MHINSYCAGFIIITLSMVFNPVFAQSNVSKKDLQVASKVLNFMVPKVSGSVPMAVVFDGNDAISVAEAENILSTIGNGLKAGKTTISATKVDVSSLTDLAMAKIIMVTAGTVDYRDEIKIAAENYGLITISTDMTCVEAAKCAIGISSIPKIVIAVSASAVAGAEINFAPAFLMMVKEVQ